jgi:primosomal protein N' (replication factor Y)
MKYDIWVGSQRNRVNSYLSYESASVLTPGQIVEVPFRSSSLNGIVVQRSTTFKGKAKPVSKISSVTIARQNLELIRWMQAYYPAPISAIAQLFMPSVLMQPSEIPESPVIKAALTKLTAQQKQVVEQIESSKETSYMLHGVTASGKTRVYTELIKNTLLAGKSVVVLTPEIGLTTPMENELSGIFGASVVTCFHSQMTVKNRNQAWSDIAANGSPQIIIGPRSALFVPFNNLGLVILDEAHDNAYKQEQQPFYHATRVAAKLASLWGAKCIFGTATPLVADYYAFTQKSLPILTMDRPAIESDYKRKDFIIDIKNKDDFSRSRLISNQLLTEIESALKAKKQTLLFLNRRGSARTILCKDCGWHDTCPNCDTSVTYHADTSKVICHTCSFSKNANTSCPDCKGTDIIFQTPGTKTIEAEIKNLLPHAKTVRFDKDSKSSEKISKVFKAVQSGEIDILIGTQVLAKGFDLPKLSVIGVIQADVGMSIPDFTSTEKTYQQISQVAGRLGRGHGDGKLFIQTFQPESPVIKWALRQDYNGFYQAEINERLKFNFPPANYLLQVSVKRATQKGAISAIGRVHKSITPNKQLVVSDPSPAFMEKRASSYFWQIVVRSKNRTALTDVIKQLPSNTLHNIDPVDLL